MSRRTNPMGWGLAVLRRLAALPLLDDAARRARFGRFLFGASKAGFAAAGMANRPFRAARKLLQPARPAAAPAGELFDLTPTDEQRMVVESMRDFAANALRPAAAAADEAAACPPELRAQAAGLGIAAMNAPEELGGVAAERPVLTNALAFEALAHGDLGLAAAILSAPSVASALVEYGDAAQQAKYVPALTGDQPPQAAIAVLEPQPLFDPFALRTRVEKTAEGWTLHGEKQLVIGAAAAELFLVAAADESGAPALYIVESGTAGITVEAQPAMGLRAASLARVRFDGVALPADARLGGSAGMDYAEFIARSRLAWCALAAGTTQAVLDYVIPYANEREAFGEPISHKQGVAFMIANIGIELEGMRLATWRAAALAAEGKPFAREAALARSLCTRFAMQAGSDGVQVLGGHGFVKEHPVERWYRDLRAIGIMEGGLLL
ncbi:MAG TPA: acyl-CoA dehydrogenase family protein [Candidatus Binatia bacterium]|nr:acyl-CoA dehydrogenase family protein [Candidatus Binatia bacterium]